MAFYKFLNSTISARVSGSDHLKVKLIIAKSCSFLLITAMPCRITKSLEFWEFSSLLKLFFVCFDHNYGTFFKSMRFNILKRPWGRFIYILDSSNSNSFTFWSIKLASSSRSNWTGVWTGNSNGSWADKQSSHFRLSTAKGIRVKATFLFMLQSQQTNF